MLQSWHCPVSNSAWNVLKVWKCEACQVQIGQVVQTVTLPGFDVTCLLQPDLSAQLRPQPLKRSCWLVCTKMRPNCMTNLAWACTDWSAWRMCPGVWMSPEYMPQPCNLLCTSVNISALKLLSLLLMKCSMLDFATMSVLDELDSADACWRRTTSSSAATAWPRSSMTWQGTNLAGNQGTQSRPCKSFVSVSPGGNLINC